MVEVDVRREELVISYEDLPDGGAAPTMAIAQHTTPEPLVFTLLREHASPSVDVRPYERVTLTIDQVDGSEDVHYAISGEKLVDTTPSIELTGE